MGEALVVYLIYYIPIITTILHSLFVWPNQTVLPPGRAGHRRRPCPRPDAAVANSGLVSLEKCGIPYKQWEILGKPKENMGQYGKSPINNGKIWDNHGKTPVNNPFLLFLNPAQILKTSIHLQFLKISDWPFWLLIDPKNQATICGFSPLNTKN